MNTPIKFSIDQWRLDELDKINQIVTKVKTLQGLHRYSAHSHTSNSMKTKLAFFFILTSYFILEVHAGSATWKVDPSTNSWNSASNWTPATVPNSPSDTATFPGSNGSAVVINSSVELNALVFSSNAFPYTITLGDAAGLSIVNLVMSGTGISNNMGSPALQTINAGPNLAANGAKNTLSFHNNATVFDSSGILIHVQALGGQSADFV